MHIVIRDDGPSVRSADIADHVECVVAGSSPECHAYLPDVRVAEQHFRLCRRDGETWWLEPCEILGDSPAGYTRLFVNAIEVTDPIPVKQNDEIHIARFRLSIFVDDAKSSAPRSNIMEAASKIREHPLPSGALVRGDAFAELTLPAGATMWLTSFSFMIHECLDLAALMTTSIHELTRRFRCRRIWLGMRRRAYGRLEFVESRYADGSTAGDPPRLETYEFRCTDRGQLILCPRSEDAGVESLMCVPLVATSGVLGMVYVESKENEPPFSEQDLGVLTAMATIIARQLELIAADQARLHEAIVAGELSFMRELQARMDPTNAPQWSGLQLAVYCKPGLDSAGDIYDVMRLPNGLASFLCGHVEGSPTHAALAMAEVRASFRMAGLHADPPHVLHRALNWLLFDPQAPTSLCSVGVIMNPKTGAMQFATAGRIGAVIVGNRGNLRSLVHPSAPNVGSTRDYVYNSAGGRLEEGETMVLFSPGCQTVRNAAGEALGKTTLLDALCDAFGQSASTVLDEFLSDLRDYFKEGRQPDDITIMVVHRE
jgi:serine phosphatase RsbU (regulator of sigma subunit)